MNFLDPLIFNYYETDKPVTDAFEAMNDKVRKCVLGAKERKKKIKN